MPKIEASQNSRQVGQQRSIRVRCFLFFLKKRKGNWKWYVVEKYSWQCSIQQKITTKSQHRKGFKKSFLLLQIRRIAVVSGDTWSRQQCVTGEAPRSKKEEVWHSVKMTLPWEAVKGMWKSTGMDEKVLYHKRCNAAVTPQSDIHMSTRNRWSRMLGDDSQG